MTLREAAEQALECCGDMVNGWESLAPLAVRQAAIESLDALRAALAEPEAEPVAWMESPYGEIRRNPLYKIAAPQSVEWSIPLYAALAEEAVTGEYVDKMISAYQQGRDHGCEMEPITDEKLHEIIKQHITISDTHLLAAVYMICRNVEAAHGILEDGDRD